MHDDQNERNPAGGPGSEVHLAVANASPSYRCSPRAGTVRGDVLAALEAGRSMTGGHVWKKFAGSRLAARCARTAWLAHRGRGNRGYMPLWPGGQGGELPRCGWWR